MTYIDGFLGAVPTANKAAYTEHAREASEIFREYGAISLVECWGDDVPEGEVNSMHTAVLRKEDETVVFSWITWPSKDVRDKGMKGLMEDPRMKTMGETMPFDGKRMIFGGFEVIVED